MSALANQKPQPDGNGRGLKGPLISLDTLDGPTQRFWASCAFIALLAYKISFILSSSSSLSATSILSHPFFMTLLYCLVMSQLRVPKLDYSGSRWTFFFFCLIAFDWFFDGGWRSILTYIPILNWIASWGTGVCNAVLFGACDSSTSLSLSERRVSLRELISPSSHFLGQHTIHILPHATARFSLSQTSIGTSSSCFCLGPTSPSITIPISFNNTEPIWLQYSVTPFQTSSQDYDTIIQPQLFNVSISKNDLISETEALKEEGSVGGDGHGGGKVSSRKISSASSSSSKGNWRKSAEIARQKARGDGKFKSSSSSSSGSHFKPSTKIYYLQISQVGRIRLEQVVDSQKNGASPSLSEIVVVECPSTAFNLPRIHSTSQEESQKSKSKASTLPSAVDPVDHYCPSDSAELEVFVHGTSPLELEYSRTFTPSSVDPQNKSKPSKKEKFTISHISSPHPQGLEAKESLPVAIRNEKGRSNSNLKDYSWALSQEMRLPVAMDLVSPGKYSYRLETVRDACGNSVDVSSSITSSDSTSIKGNKKRKALLSSLAGKGGIPPSAPSPAISSREIVVHPRPKIAFSNCSAGKSLKLLKDGPSIQLALGLRGVENQRLDPSTDGGPWEANVAFIPDSNSATSAWERNLTIFSSGPRASQLQANSSGTYTLSGVSGRYCSGEIASPWSCQVEYIPPPTASIEFSSIEDRCAGQVGIKALVLLSGTPPFTLSYQTTEHGKTSPAVKTIERIKIDRTRHEIEFRPHTEGKVTYAFVELRDANYEKISLDGPVTTQEVHPLATASFLSANGQKSPKASPVPQTSASRRAIQQRDSIEQLREGLAPQRVVMHSCTGDDTSANAEVELSGTGPFDLTYTLRSSGNTESEGGKKHGKSKSGGGSSSSETTSHTVKGISGPKHTLNLDLPSHISQRGGEVTLSLVNIKDARGCERPLVSPDIIYEVRRDRPTVSFVSPNNIVGEAREIKILEGQEATLPLRLEGNSPWDLEYVRLEPDEDVEEALKKLRDPSNKSKLQLLKSKVKTSDGNIKVNKSGRYVIFSSKDSFCNGEVLVAKDYLVSSKPKPEVHFLPDSGVQSSKNVSLLRAPVCRGKADSVDIEMRGRFPIHIGYEHSIPSWSGSDQVESQIGAGGSSSNSASSSHSKKVKETFSSAQNITSLQLSTSVPGWHVYELKEIGDALYPVTQLSSDVKSSSEGSRRLEQMVYPLPSVSLSSSGKPPSFCLHDSLSPSNFENSKGGKLSPNQYPTLSLTGSPPFSVEIQLRHLPSGSESSASIASDRSFTIDNIQTHTHPIELSREQFSFDNTGSWNLKVKSVRDKNDCFTAVVGGKNGAGFNLEVAETASITSKGNRDDYCVGESVDFVLQGSAPWTVVYNFAGKKASASVRNPDFSRIADKPGELRIESVAHQQNKCKHELKKNDTSLIKTVHDLPTVKVSAGKHFIEDLREGNQAEIIFDLNGVPPFSFTYQRTETVDTHSHPKVLETHTVTGILEHRYSIWTSLEGTWTVNWLQDRWCAVSIDGGTATGLGRGRLAIEN